MFFQSLFETSGALIGAALLFFALLAYCLRRIWRVFDQLSRGLNEFYSAVEMQKEGGIYLFNLALVNNSSEDVWAEECEIFLSDFDGRSSAGFKANLSGTLRVREFIPKGQTLAVGLSQTVYEAAGRAQDEYSFVISGALKYCVENTWYHRAFRARRVRMHGLDPIEVRKARRSGADSADNESILLELANH